MSDFGLPEPRPPAGQDPSAAGDPPEGQPTTGGPGPVGGLTRTRVGVALGALLLVVAVAVTVGVDRRSTDPTAAVGGRPSSTVSTPVEGATTPTVPPVSRVASPTRPPVSPTPVPPPVAAVVPGWLPVVGRELAAFDVPPSWHPEESSAITGFEYHDDSDARLVTMHNLASYRTGVCPQIPGSARARAGFVSPRDLDVATAAPELSELWGDVAGLQLGGREARLSPTRTVQTTVGTGVPATESTTLVRFPDVTGCQAPAMTITALAFEHRGAVVVFVLWTDEQTPDGVRSVDAQRILRSVRPVG